MTGFIAFIAGRIVYFACYFIPLCAILIPISVALGAGIYHNPWHFVQTVLVEITGISLLATVAAGTGEIWWGTDRIYVKCPALVPESDIN